MGQGYKFDVASESKHAVPDGFGGRLGLVVGAGRANRLVGVRLRLSRQMRQRRFNAIGGLGLLPVVVGLF